MNKYSIAIIAIVGGLIAVMLMSRYNAADKPELDDFAKCLRDKGVTMYGADWCPHCRNEKNLFGSAFRFVPYVECPDEPALCAEKEIQGYPTWIFPASPAGGPDEKKLESEQGLERLSRESGCEFNKKVGS